MPRKDTKPKTTAQRQKDHRAGLRAAGRCVQCKEPSPDSYRCDDCRAGHRVEKTAAPDYQAISRELHTLMTRNAVQMVPVIRREIAAIRADLGYLIHYSEPVRVDFDSVDYGCICNALARAWNLPEPVPGQWLEVPDTETDRQTRYIDDVNCPVCVSNYQWANDLPLTLNVGDTELMATAGIISRRLLQTA